MAADFTLDFPEGKEIRILQVTDTQIIDSSQCRYEGRLCEREMDLWRPEKIEERMGRYLRGAVEESAPDMLVHTGDFSYGEFDDKGTSFERHIEMMDAFKKPWCLAFGNHERETNKGTRYLCDKLENCQYGLFKGENGVDGVRCEGDGNYSVLLRRGEKAVAMLYFLDSGVGNDVNPAGVYDGQKRWLRLQAEAVKGVPAYAFFHIPPACVEKKLETYGYQKEGFTPYEIPSNEDGDVGFVGEWGHPNLYIDRDGSLMALFEEIGVRRVFTGHIHKHAFTLRCGSILVTHGVKTGEYDSHDKGHLGGTLLIIGEDGCSKVEDVIVK